jgi:hypothetical protein
MTIRERIRQLLQIRHIVECNGSDWSLAHVDEELEMIYHESEWNGD